MSKIWYTSDEHYYHHNMLLFREFEEKQRPFRTTDEMHRYIKKNHNAVVAPEDVVYHLGDFAYGPGAKSWQQVGSILHGLNGQHHLILGNHCHLRPFDYVEAGFQSVHTSLVLEDYLLVHDPAIAGVFKQKKVIHGHTHTMGVNLAPNTYCVCVELHDYTPVEFSTIKRYFDGLNTETELEHYTCT